MACRINSILRCPSDVLLFSPKCFLQSSSHIHTSLNLNPNPIKISCCRRRRNLVVVKSRITTEAKSISDNRMLVFVSPHALIKHWVSVLRNEQTPSPVFRNAMAELGRLLMCEASRDWLPTFTGEIQSPMGIVSVEFIDRREPVAG